MFYPGTAHRNHTKLFSIVRVFFLSLLKKRIMACPSFRNYPVHTHARTPFQRTGARYVGSIFQNLTTLNHRPTGWKSINDAKKNKPKWNEIKWNNFRSIIFNSSIISFVFHRAVSIGNSRYSRVRLAFVRFLSRKSKNASTPGIGSNQTIRLCEASSQAFVQRRGKSNESWIDDRNSRQHRELRGLQGTRDDRRQPANLHKGPDAK